VPMVARLGASPITAVRSLESPLQRRRVTTVDCVTFHTTPLTSTGDDFYLSCGRGGGGVLYCSLLFVSGRCVVK